MFNIIQSDWGIGDVICSLYAIQGLANKQPESEITLYTRQHLEWAALADMPRLSVRKFYEQRYPADAIWLYNDKEDADKRIKHTNSPKKYFASKLGVEPVKPALKPEIACQGPIIGGDYIVLSPYASRLNRTWAIHNWRILARELQNAGYKVIALDGPNEGKRISQVGVEYFWGQSPSWNANVCLHAKMVIGNDSGLAHLGGWLGVKTLVIMSQLLPEQFYDYTGNRFVVPQQKCTGCRFVGEYGYEEKCDYGCWVLQSVRPQEVLEAALGWLREEKAGAEVLREKMEV